MTEAFLYYLWQFQYFNKNDLKTVEGDVLQVFEPGIRNAHAGPDFLNARLRIGPVEWVGNVEIHHRTSDWYSHHHHTDPAYENVVLHVVWKHDRKVERNDQTVLPTMALAERTDDALMLKYKELINTPLDIPCAAQIGKTPKITRVSMLDRSAMQRLEHKAEAITQTWTNLGNDWEETTYRLLFKNFGFKVNAEPFGQLAQLVPYKRVLKEPSLLKTEALLFGMAGFLEGKNTDAYFQDLKQEYQFIQQKYGLAGHGLNKAPWRFFRLRPANFPTLRLAQLSALLHCQKNIFSQLMEATSFSALRHLLLVEPSPYWHQHYHFKKTTAKGISTIGDMGFYNVVINTVVPLLVAYGKQYDEQAYVDRAIYFLQQVPAENNSLVRKWKSLGLEVDSAFDSQAFLELHNGFCLKRRCLECNIGAALISPDA